MQLLTWMVGGILLINVIRLYLAIRSTRMVSRQEKRGDAWVKEQSQRWDKLKVSLEEK